MRITLLIVASLTTACVSAPTRRPMEKTPTPRSAPGGVHKSGGGPVYGGIGPIIPIEALLLTGLFVGAISYGIYALASGEPTDEIAGPNVGDAAADVCPLGPVSCDTHGR